MMHIFHCWHTGTLARAPDPRHPGYSTYGYERECCHCKKTEVREYTGSGRGRLLRGFL